MQPDLQNGASITRSFCTGALRSVRTWAVALVACALALMWSSQITDSRIESDAQQSTHMAVNLARHDVMSLDESAPYHPTNFREPVPVLVTALGVWILDSILGPCAPDDYLEGPRAKYLKYQNFFWLGLLSISAFVAARTLTSSFWLALFAVILVNRPLLPQQEQLGPVDNLLTELPATALLLPASILLAIAFTNRKWSAYVLAGVLFGIFGLIKAIGIYVFLGVLPVLACLYALQQPAIPWRIAARDLGVLMASFACVLAPWIVRNHILLDSYQITQRGGESLFERALEDQMTDDEFLGTFYIWGHPGPFHDWLGKKLQLSESDLLRGGRLQRLNSDFSTSLSRVDRDTAVDDGRPDQAITLFRKAQAQRTRLEREFAAAGSPQPQVAAEEQLYRLATTMISQHPLRHLKLTAAFMWRGAPLAFAILSAAIFFGLLRRRYDLLLFSLPAIGIVMAYSLFTPFFWRYGWPSRLVATVTAVALIKLIWDLIPVRRTAPVATRPN
jgi:hypothetical protein